MCGACRTAGCTTCVPLLRPSVTRMSAVLRALLETKLLLGTTLSPAGLCALVHVLDTEELDTRGKTGDPLGSRRLQRCASQLAQVCVRA